MDIRDELNVKRLELALLEADCRIVDLEAEIEKVKDKRAATEKSLKELKEGLE